jgi:hypothetical protein
MSNQPACWTPDRKTEQKETWWRDLCHFCKQQKCFRISCTHKASYVYTGAYRHRGMDTGDGMQPKKRATALNAVSERVSSYPPRICLCVWLSRSASQLNLLYYAYVQYAHFHSTGIGRDSLKSLYYLNPWNKTFLVKLLVAQLFQKLSLWIGFSLPCSQYHAIGRNYEPN